MEKPNKKVRVSSVLYNCWKRRKAKWIKSQFYTHQLKINIIRRDRLEVKMKLIGETACNIKFFSVNRF